MQRNWLLSLSLVCAASAAVQPAAAYAQSADTGAIAGTVVDANGAAIPGAALVATDTETQQTFKATSNGKGEFRLPQLPPAVYTLTVDMAGFKQYLGTKITVAVGVIANVSPALQVGGNSETVEVSNESPLMHTESAEISSVVDQNEIDNLPINGRRASNFALLTPGVVSNGDGFGLLSFRGISFLLNNSQIDGLDDNQAYFSEQRGRTRAAYNISQTAVQEFQVNTSNFSAEYGRSAGGVINTVTKSGGNQFHGELFFYDRDNDFGAINPYTDADDAQIPGSSAYITNLRIQAQGLAQAVGLRHWRADHPRQVVLLLLVRPVAAELSQAQQPPRPPRPACSHPASATLPDRRRCRASMQADTYSQHWDVCTGRRSQNADGSFSAALPDWQLRGVLACGLRWGLNPAEQRGRLPGGGGDLPAGTRRARLLPWAPLPRNSDQVINFPQD